MQMLKQIDSEVVIGQLSYKQIADIFNHVHAYQEDATTYRICRLYNLLTNTSTLQVIS